MLTLLFAIIFQAKEIEVEVEHLPENILLTLWTNLRKLSAVEEMRLDRITAKLKHDICIIKFLSHLIFLLLYDELFLRLWVWEPDLIKSG